MDRNMGVKKRHRQAVALMAGAVMFFPPMLSLSS